MNVKWDSEKCCHSGICVQTLPEVFKIKNGQFIIEPEQADDESIQEVLNQCPSKALTKE